MSIHVTNFTEINATPLDFRAAPGVGTFDLAQLLRTAETYSLTDRDAAIGCLNRARLLLEIQVSDSRKSGLAPWQIKRINRYISERLEHEITLSDLSSLVRLSTSHFSKVFKESFGTSPLAHVQAKRIDRAKDLILVNDRPLAEIALDCGFCDQAHFSRLFRKRTGLSPSLWRKMYLTDDRA